MQQIERQTVSALVTTDIICNKCGNSCKDDRPDQNEENFVPSFTGLLETEVIGGYFSNYLDDLGAYRFSLCEKCLSELFATFKIQPLTYEVNIYHERVDEDGRRYMLDTKDTINFCRK